MSQLLYSPFAGIYWEVPEGDFSLTDVTQIPLTKRPSKCNKCFNRGHLGRDKVNYVYLVCNCVRKVIDRDKIKRADSISKV